MVTKDDAVVVHMLTVVPDTASEIRHFTRRGATARGEMRPSTRCER